MTQTITIPIPATSNVTWANSMSESAHPISKIAMADPTISWYTPILSWFTADFFHIAIALFVIILAYQAIQNFKNKQSRIGRLTALGMLVMSIWGVLLKYNLWLGIILSFISFWLLVEANKYKDSVEEAEDDVEPAKQPTTAQLPNRQPIRPLPQPHAWDGYGMPSVGINFGGRCL